ncbi:hypothetical protein A6K76_10675 [Caryophanon latum]|uniref:Uncharacterized protein n=1 Tax=Caryophanon latum TaxID=33977 RepID=A0A1C0YTW2_9BACL|nr:hypothetical protein A6K76_10675 [Caryophanon latum]
MRKAISATSMWHRLHDQHRVRRRAPGIYLPRVIAEAKRAAIRELPVEWLINTLDRINMLDEKQQKELPDISERDNSIYLHRH